MPERYKSAFDIASFGALPVQTGGRLLPIDSVARNTLRIISSKESIYTAKKAAPERKKISAIEWLIALTFEPESAATYPIFRIDNPDVLAVIGHRLGEQKYFAYSELSEFKETIYEQAKKANPEAGLRSIFERQILKLNTAINLYERLSWSFHAGGDLDTLSAFYRHWQRIIGPGKAAFAQRESKQAYNTRVFDTFASIANEFIGLSKMADLGIVPPQTESAKAQGDWENVGESLLHSIQTGQINPIIIGYAKLAESYRLNNAEIFNQALIQLHQELKPESIPWRIHFESFFNHFQPFYQSIILYVLAFTLLCIAWLKCAGPLNRAAYGLILLAFAVQSFGLIARMLIQGRPPVTNLYSSAVFIGWAAVLLGIILERLYRNGLGTFVSAVIGFITLIIAHNLARTGDTLEMMRAVLDSNFWLATHVVVITMGYSSVFLAGTLAIVYIIRNRIGKGLDKETRKSLYKMVYGITCFSLLFSFVGTMLGGIWADQSWGRFWGWDPKENGALLIVLWCALMLHARIGGIVKTHGFMILAVGGNITIGLHSYGFTDSGFFWLVIFWLSQILVIGFACLPERNNFAERRQIETLT